jgi:hypothetical protein
VSKDSHEAWKARQQRRRRFAEANIRAMERGKAIRQEPAAKPPIAPNLKVGVRPTLKVILCSPHPDDEGLLIRLRRECGAQGAGADTLFVSAFHGHLNSEVSADGPCGAGSAEFV